MNAARAYAFARVCAMRGSLLQRDDLFAVRAATDAATALHAAAALGIDSEEKRLARLLRRYERIRNLYPQHRDLVDALRRLREVEEVKRGWRTAQSLHAYVETLAKTPYASIVREIYAAHRDDLAAAELAFDRWASDEAVRAANALPRGESLARALVLRIVRKRDDELRARGADACGLSPAAIETAVSVREKARRIANPFIGTAFRLAPAVALIELAEHEYDAATAVVERAGDARLDDVTDARVGG